MDGRVVIEAFNYIKNALSRTRQVVFKLCLFVKGMDEIPNLSPRVYILTLDLISIIKSQNEPLGFRYHIPPILTGSATCETII